MDAHANLARSTVAVAPSPADTGTSLTVATGQGVRFPAVPFDATVWPAGVAADPSNAEIVRVTARTGDILTITRQAELGGTSRSILVTDQIAATVTVKSLADIETAVVAETTRAQAAEALLAPLASPALTGNPTAPTQTPGANNTRLATTAYADGSAVTAATAAQTAAQTYAAAQAAAARTAAIGAAAGLALALGS